jgi:hypothetical protein
VSRFKTFLDEAFAVCFGVLLDKVVSYNVDSAKEHFVCIFFEV